MPEPDFKILQRGESLAGIGRFKEALPEFYKFLSSEPENYLVLCHIARCHYELNDLKTALKFANAAIAVGPEGEWAYRLKSFIFRASGNHQESLKAAEECVSKAPHLIFSLQTLAYAQINNFRLDDAEKTLKLMLEAAPDDALTHDACGFLALKRENYEAAEKYFLQSLKIDAESANSLSNLGFIYLEKSRTVFGMFKKSELGKRAKECFLSALKINPNFILAQQNLEAAENNRFYLGSRKNKVVFKWFLVSISMSIFSRIAVEFVPPLINLFTPYKPQLFYAGVNLIFIFFILISLFNVFLSRRAAVPLENIDKFARKSVKVKAAHCLMLVLPQLIFGFFLAFLENDMSALAWMILIFAGAVLYITTLKVFQYFDGQVEE
jgi:tetratricopeptide (TPR) repeat protein